MAISKIVQNSIDETSVSLGVKITNVQVANSSYTVLDDTAVNVGGGYIVITGAGFKESAQVLVGQNTACSVTIIDSTTIRAEVPAKDAGTYPVYVVNTDGAVGIRVPGLTYSGYPTWVTDSTLPDQGVDEAIEIQLDATGANSYVLQTGSTLPSGVNLAANGLITGTITGVEEDTLYNFTIEAIDIENQESPRAFNVTITVGDDYFNQTVLLLDGDGTSGANNNVFRDSSNNNFAITRNGNVTQGTFTPFSLPDGWWSNYFDDSGDYLQISSNSAFSFGTSDFTIECWFNAYTLNAAASGQDGIITMLGSVGLYVASDAVIVTHANVATLNNFLASLTKNTWYHLALTRSGTDMKAFINGVQTGTTFTNSTNFSNNGNVRIGTETSQYFHGNISNLRVIKGTALYTSNFTPPTGPLTAVSGTSLLTCQSNRFKDNSTNNFTLTPSGDVKVTPFSPFAPAAAYSAATNGGSAYFDGTGDNLSFTANSAFAFGTGDFSIEAWVYPLAAPGGAMNICGTRGEAGSTTAWNWGILNNLSSQMYTNGAIVNTGAGTVPLNTWTLISMVRSSGTLKSYINGVEKASTSNTQDLTTTNFWIGMTGGTAEPFNGYISSLRLIKGTAITPSVPTSPYIPITNTSLLCNFTNAGILDYTTKNVIETLGNSQVNTTTKKYGTGSMYFDGTGDYLKLPPSPNLSFGGDFTIEYWVKTNVFSLDTYYRRTLCFGEDAANNLQFIFLISGVGASSNIGIYTDSLIITGTIPVADDNWNHVALSRSGTSLKLFVNGAQSGSTVTTSQNFNAGATNGMFVARYALDGGYINGYIDDLRITRGFARYTTTFTPPDEKFRKR
jgi:hypothetical protein